MMLFLATWVFGLFVIGALWVMVAAVLALVQDGLFEDPMIAVAGFVGIVSTLYMAYHVGKYVLGV